MIASKPNVLEEWERAEIARSRHEASQRAKVRRTSPAVLRRYTNPPVDTQFPLEYTYHLVGDIRGQDVLDYGCGDGRDASLLASRGPRRVYALDLSHDLLQQAAMRVREDGLTQSVQVLCGSAHAVPLPDESIDLVVGHAVLHHLDLVLASREVHRLLRPGGRAIFLEPIRQSRVLRAIRPLIPIRHADVSPFERPLLESEINAFSRPFHLGRRRQFMLPFVRLAKVMKAPEPLQARMRALDGRLLASHPWLRTYASLTVFELRKPDRPTL
jgi:SAM-dependent methyltransferase